MHGRSMPKVYDKIKLFEHLFIFLFDIHKLGMGMEWTIYQYTHDSPIHNYGAVKAIRCARIIVHGIIDILYATIESNNITIIIII